MNRENRPQQIMDGEIEHAQLICGEAFAVVNGVLLDLERVPCDPPEEDE